MDGAILVVSRGGRPDAADPRAHPARPPGERAVDRRLPQQVRPGGRPGAARPGRARGARAADASTSSRATTRRSSAARRSRRSRATRASGWRRSRSCATRSTRYIPEPKREMDKPFLMPVEDVFSITGRGTVATGRIERGKIKVGEEVAVVGFGDRQEDGRHRRRDVPQAARRGRGGRQRRPPAPRRREERDRARHGAGQAGHDHAAHEVQGRGVRPDQGRGRPPHAVLQGLPAAVLLPDHGRHRLGRAARRASRWSCRATTSR